MTRGGVKAEARGSRERARDRVFIFFPRSPRARDSETSRRQRDSQLVLCVSMRDTRMHGDVNSRLYVRSARTEGAGGGRGGGGEGRRRRGEADYIGRH